MTNSRNLEESIAIPIAKGEQLHLRRIFTSPEGTPVFMLHGIGEDGTVFYNDDGEGIAHQLAYDGFDVYIGDLRGHGRSWPAIGEETQYTAYQAIRSDIPAFLEAIFIKRRMVPPLIVTHGWGAALFSAFVAREPESIGHIKGVIHFSPYRRGGYRNKFTQLKMDWLYRRIALLLISYKGYLPGKGLKIMPGNEAANIYRESLDWLESIDWIDGKDGFDYRQALEAITFPPSLYFAEKKMGAPGDMEDTRLFMQELGRHNARMIVMGKKAGGERNYGQGQLISNGMAVAEQLPSIKEWLQGLEVAF